VWICRGEVFGKKDLSPNFTQQKETGRGNNAGGKRFRNRKSNNRN
jgi:small subunit ribosomal protein S3